MDTKPIRELIQYAKEAHSCRGCAETVEFGEAIAAAEQALAYGEKALRLADELSAEVETYVLCLGDPEEPFDITATDLHEKARDYRKARGLE